MAVTDIGGKVVWVLDTARDLSLYYAHLDSQGVSPGTRVRAGDALGTVGNTGNARTTVPHLHFGIYDRREGPIDPMPFVHEPPAAPALPVPDTSALGTWRRIETPDIPLSTSPVNRAAVVVELPRHTVVRVLGVTAGWYRVRLPDAPRGVRARGPRRSRRRAAPERAPRGRQSRFATARPPRRRRSAICDPDRPVPVLGRFSDYLLVRADTGTIGWLASEPNSDDRSSVPR